MNTNNLKKSLKDAVIGAVIFLFIYLLLSFFLKSEYPLAEHSFNGSDAYDVIKDSIALLSPFVIAYIIYHIWHAQKGKEVIAYEARELIKDFLEYIVALGKLSHLPPKIHEELVSEVENLKSLKLRIFRCIHYLTECMEDKSLEKLVDEYLDKESLLEQEMNFMSRKLEPIQFKRDIEAAESQIEEVVVLAEQIINEIKPYSTYQKKFTFK